MAFPTGWGRKCAVVIDSTYVSGTTHSDFPMLVTAAMLPSEMFDADGSYPALNGGGDIRFSSDSAGSTQLACEVVSFVTDNDPANGSAEIWVKVPTLSGSANTTIYVWYNKSGESQPAVTDTYGRNAVWADYFAVYHGDDTTDATGNGYTLTPQNSAASGDTNGKIGDAFSLNGSNQYFESTISKNIADIAVSLQGWIRPDLDTGLGQTVVCTQKLDADYDLARLAIQDNIAGNPVRADIYKLNPGGGQNTADSTSGANFSGWNFTTAVFNSSGHSTVYLNGQNSSSVSTDEVNCDTFTRLYIGSRLSVSGSLFQYADGLIDEVRVRDTNVSNITADWIATEYNNQNSPGTFATAGTPESVGGAATVTLSALPGEYTISGVTTNLLANRLLSGLVGSFSITGITSSLYFNRLISAVAGTYGITGQESSLLVSRLLSAQADTFTFTGNDVTLTYTPVGNLTLSAIPGTYSITGDTASLAVSRLLAATSDTYVITGATATLSKGITLVAESGVYEITGNAANLIKAYLLTAQTGAFDITGGTATLNKSGITTLSPEDIAAIVAAMEDAGFLKLKDWIALR